MDFTSGEETERKKGPGQDTPSKIPGTCCLQPESLCYLECLEIET